MAFLCICQKFEQSKNDFGRILYKKAAYTAISSLMATILCLSLSVFKSEKTCASTLLKKPANKVVRLNRQKKASVQQGPLFTQIQIRLRVNMAGRVWITGKYVLELLSRGRKELRIRNVVSGKKLALQKDNHSNHFYYQYS